MVMLLTVVPKSRLCAAGAHWVDWSINCKRLSCFVLENPLIGPF